ncbi:MAG: Fic family protein [Synergistaceae bacterium]|nr:Fic family protein [Synergistaceae bacterium]
MSDKINFNGLDILKDKLKSLRPLNAAELERLREEFMVDSTYNSNAIEGNSLSLRETALVLQQGVTIDGKRVKDHLEAIGHRDAFYYMAELADVGSMLTERVIRELHSLVLMNDARNKGIYRTIEVAIAGARNSPSPHYLIAERMDALLADYEDMKRDMYIIEAIAAFHLRFEGIHPFIDGNGRTGRLIMNLELIKSGMMPVNIKFTDRVKYYDCFDADGFEPLARLLLAYEEEEILKYIAKFGR